MGAERVVVVTGASSGIGAVVAEQAAGRGDRVAVVGRDAGRTRSVAERVGGDAFVADFARLDEVRGLADALRQRYGTVDVLLANAGGLVSKRGTTVDGHDLGFQVNHLAPYLLTRLMLPALRAAAAAGRDARVVATASAANRWGRIRFDDLEGRRRPWLGGWLPYCTAKLAVVLTVKELARRESAVQAFSVHRQRLGADPGGHGADRRTLGHDPRGGRGTARRARVRRAGAGGERHVLRRPQGRRTHGEAGRRRRGGT
jgi:NAD(P)-dependent dehydrogenase (short-subunit alcohol dehydrogenase family)